jgi:hypothetical protein
MSNRRGPFATFDPLVNRVQGWLQSGSDGPRLNRDWSEPAMAAVFPGLAVLLGLTMSGRSFDLLPSQARMGVVLAWPIVALLVAGAGRIWIGAAYMVVSGFVLRWVDFWPGGGSDVLPTVTEAIKTLLSGHSPYDHYYLATRPPGGHMPYPPGQLLLHFPGFLLDGYDGVRLTELFGALFVMLVLAWFAVRHAPTVGMVALGLYAGLPNLINLTGDSGNDTSAGAVVFGVVLVLLWASRRGMDVRSAVVAGMAVAFMLSVKQSTLLFGVAFSMYILFSYRRAIVAYLAGGAAVLLAVSAPLLLLGPVQYINGLTQIPPHDIQVYGWNWWVLWKQVGYTVPDGHTVSIVNAVVTLAGLIAVFTLAPRGVATAATAGVIATLAALLTADWTAYSYYAMVLPTICLIAPLLTYEMRSWRQVPAEAPAPEANAPSAPAEVTPAGG